MMTARLLAMALALLAVCSPSAGHAETEVGNAFCLVEPTEAALPEYSSQFGAQTYYFCCSDCVDSFNANPGKYVDVTAAGDGDARSGWLLWFDGVWNTAARTPGLVLGGLTLVALLILRFTFRKLRPVIGAKTIATVVGLTLGAEAFSAHHLRRQDARAYLESELIHQVHASTFHEYGHPPVPARPDLPPRLEAVFYRGNDERSSQLYNRGYYRTCDFKLDLCNAEGAQVSYGDPANPADLFLRVRVVRAPGTPDFFWEPERMANIFASRSSAKLLGRNGEPVPDAVPMEVVRPMWEWEMRYPLEVFAESSRDGRLKGIVYHCEKRFDDDEVQIGSRFHYAFQFALQFGEDGRIAQGSDLWMGATYRNRSLRIWEIPQDEWLSTEPIPVIEGENLTTDPKLLGIEGHLLDQN